MYANTVSCYDQEVVHTSCQINFPFSFRKSNKIEKGICSLLRNCWVFFLPQYKFYKEQEITFIWPYSCETHPKL